ncbi:glycosyltransferase [Atopobacter phocae]|uniref:glycosyltransferase n=1 Tax=Atopobacter phocae TaxID=136492 RepID=UPI0004713B42|nr:glycosyltransferase [Atopobacter phocae]
MKKIAFVEYDMSISGGVLTVIKDLAYHFKNNYETHMISLVQPISEQDMTEGIIYQSFDIGNGRVRKILSQSILPLIKYVNENKVDIVLLEGHFVAPLSIFLRYFTKAKVIFCDHGAIENQLSHKLVTLYRKIGVNFSNYTVVLTQQSVKAYIKFLNASPKKISSIYNAVPITFREAKNIYTGDKNKIITITRLSEEKGLNLLVEVAEKLKEEALNKHWKWHIYGTGVLYDDLKQEIRDRSLDCFLSLKGFIQSPVKVFGDYDLSVLTSYREGLPVVLLESLAMGVPPISFDVVTGPNEIIKTGVNGILVKPYDINQMANEISKLMNNVSLKKIYSDNSKDTLEKFLPEEVYSKWNDLFEELIK